MKTMARNWTGVRRPVEELAIRRSERRGEPTAEWWRKWNELDGGEWARERASEERCAQRLLRAMFNGDEAKTETEKARRLARALGLLPNGGER
jgi:hypothetical protein